MLQYIPTKSLKNKLILYFLLITILPAVTISFFYYKTSQDALENNMIKTSVNDLHYIGDIIDKQMKFAEQLSDWAFINPTLDKILTKRYTGRNYDAEIYNFQGLMDFQLRNTSVGTHVSSFLIIGNNGVDLRVGTEGAQVDTGAIHGRNYDYRNYRRAEG
jgi:two-component system sensor histidine kinase YesM